MAETKNGLALIMSPIESEIKALIELRDQRRAEDDKQGEQETLEQIGQYTKTEQGWEILKKFYTENRLETRFEILTRQLIRGGNISRPSPFIEVALICVRSGRLEEARLTLRQCICKFPNTQDYSWDLANLLISSEEYAQAERLVAEMLKQNPTDFACNVLLWRLLQKMSSTRKAGKVLNKLRLLAGSDSGKLVWYASLAMEGGSLQLATNTAKEVRKRVQSGEIRFDPAIAHLFDKLGFKEECRVFLDALDPERYESFEDLAYLCKLALEFGTPGTSLRIGEALMRRRNDRAVAAVMQRAETAIKNLGIETLPNANF